MATSPRQTSFAYRSSSMTRSFRQPSLSRDRGSSSLRTVFPNTGFRLRLMVSVRKSSLWWLLSLGTD
ncbi:hypothetical protein TYRP_002908 [Tyrophagus putrescentiae]|nr:hypothetical protein TYRP_002908 [Tyrophagus putrescentiae]